MHCFPESQQDRFVHCLTSNGDDPPTAVVAFLADGNRQPVPGSECMAVLESRGRVHTAAGRPAILRTPGPVSRSYGEASRAWESTHHGLHGAGRVCLVGLKSGKWQLQYCRQLAVS